MIATVTLKPPAAACRWRSGLAKIGIAGMLLTLASCVPGDPFNNDHPRFFAPEQYPKLLSQWNLLLRKGDVLLLHSAAQTYDINMPLFSDYAAKHRSLWLPPDTRASRNADGKLVLPVGSIISKTFLYPEGHAGSRDFVRLTEPSIAASGAHVVETRLSLIHI